MLLTLILAAQAAPCDIKALQASFEAASPSSSGKIYAEMAACDAAAAKNYAPTAFTKILSGEGGDAAALAAISVGAGDQVRAWAMTREPDERSALIKTLGGACDKPGVPAFFTATATGLGDKFWSEGWYTGLATCRDPGVQNMLKTAVAAKTSDRSRYFSILSVFARNLGKDAVPVLRAMLQQEKDPEIAATLVQTFLDAADADPAAKAPAIAAITELAPTLPDQAVNQARTALLTLGAEAESDALALFRYDDRKQADGSLLYGVAVIEVATCKKGDTRVEVHAAKVKDPGRTWPDQLATRTKDHVASGFTLTLGDRCKGTATTTTVTPEQPFKDAAEYSAWVDSLVEEAAKKNKVEAKRVDEDDLAI